MATDYAIIQTGGKQYRVQAGDSIAVEKIAAEEGSTVEFDRVLLVSRDAQVTLGHPTVEGAKVLAEVRAQVRGEKIIVLKFRHRTRYTVKQGHRQSLTRLAIKEIVTGGSPEAPRSPAPRRRRAAGGA